MFAPKVAKPPAKVAGNPASKLAPQRSTPTGYGPGRNPVERAIVLQHAIGNQATLQQLQQLKVGVGQFDAALEHEANRTADQVMRQDAGSSADGGAVADTGSLADAGSAADAGTVADAGSTDEQPIWIPTSPVPADILADTAQDFVAKANAARGGEELGHMASTITFAPDLDAKGNISKVNLKIETSIVRPRWAGGRPNDVQRAAIARAEQLIKEHEQRHRDIARDFANRMVSAMRGKSAAAAERAFKQLDKALDQAQAQLDAREGSMSVVETAGADGGVVVDVILAPATGHK